MSHFEDETAVRPMSESAGSMARFATDLTDAWNINGNPNGGYLLASSLRAVAAIDDRHPDPISVTTHYLRPGSSGEQAEISVETIRSGRRTSTLRTVMTQGGKPRITSLVTMSDLELWSGPGVASIEPPPVAPLSACIDRSMLPQGVDLPILSRVDVRLDPATVEPSVDEARAFIAGWIRFADATPPSALALPLFADAFPPSLIGLLGQVGWIPTVELTVQVRARPVDGWVRACFESRDIGGGMLVEDGLLWDAESNLVAQSRQLALILSRDFGG
ncbi:MAG: thioesterase family protein [Acidimicrobiia bacterium]|nr:thioesterase family protein [Acidimicrobiia bacterium]